MTHEHARRVAVLRFLRDLIAEETPKARAEAEKVFKEMRTEHGAKSLAVPLPDGTEIGTIAIKAGKKTVTWDMGAVVELARAVAPGEIVEVIDPAVLDDPEIRALIKQAKPDAVSETVRDSYLKRLKPDGDGQVITPDGELVKVAEVTVAPVSGEFAYTPVDGAKEAMIAAWQRGELTDVIGALALPATGQDPEPWPDPRPPAADTTDEAPASTGPAPLVFAPPRAWEEPLVFTPPQEEPLVFDADPGPQAGGPFGGPF